MKFSVDVENISKILFLDFSFFENMSLKNISAWLGGNLLLRLLPETVVAWSRNCRKHFQLIGLFTSDCSAEYCNVQTLVKYWFFSLILIFRFRNSSLWKDNLVIMLWIMIVYIISDMFIMNTVILSYSTGQRKRLGYLVGNLVATNWPIEKALHAIGCN